MASLKHLIAAGPARILGPIYAENFIVPNGTSSQILLANGSTLAKSDIVSYIQTVASTATGAYEIGKITINGTQTTIYGKDTTGGGGGGGASELNDLSDVTITGTSYSSQILKYDGTNWANVPYNIPSGTCSDSSTSAKVVTINGITVLTDGLMIRVKNSATAVSSSATLNLNGLGAKPVYYNQDGTWAQISTSSHWGANAAYTFIYDTLGLSTGRWLMLDRDFNTNTSVTPTNVTDTTAYRMLLAPGTTYSTNGQPKSTANITGTGAGTLTAVKFVTSTGTSSQFVKGDGTLGTYVNILTGSSAPTSDQGSNGDIYIKTV